MQLISLYPSRPPCYNHAIKITGSSMAAIDEFKAEYARQHPQRPAYSALSDEGLVWVDLYDRLLDRVAKLEKRQFARHHRGIDE